MSDGGTQTDREPSRVSHAVALAAAGPPIAAAMLLAVFAICELAGHPPLTYALAENVAEAAAMGSGAEVLRRLRRGEDPTAVLTIRSDLISSSITRVSAVEAAVWGRRVEVLRLLEREGALRGDSGRQYVACLATIARVPRIVEEYAPEGVRSCDTEAVLRGLEGRAP